eukprot:1685583-Amphidinium_carterae.2
MQIFVKTLTGKTITLDVEVRTMEEMRTTCKKANKSERSIVRAVDVGGCSLLWLTALWYRHVVGVRHHRQCESQDPGQQIYGCPLCLAPQRNRNKRAQAFREQVCKPSVAGAIASGSMS